jgi:hypothetical protein
MHVVNADTGSSKSIPDLLSVVASPAMNTA